MSNNSPYEITLDKIYTRVVSLLGNETEVIARFVKNLGINQTNAYFYNARSAVRVYPGPLANIKLISVSRIIFAEDNNLWYGFLSLGSVDMDADILRIEPIHEMVEPLATKPRYTAIHPNGRQFILLTDVSLQRYHLIQSKEDDRSYSLVLQNRTEFNNTWHDDLQYHPSGKYLVGIKQIKYGTDADKTQLRPFKLNPDTFQFVVGENVRGKCIKMEHTYGFPVKWVINIDRNNASRAWIGNQMNTTCLWNLDKEGINIEVHDLISNSNLTISYQGSPDKTNYPEFIATGLGILNSSSPDAYPVAYNGRQAKALFLDKPAYLASSDGLSYFNLEKVGSLAKCVDITDINAFACMHSNQHDMIINKANVQDRTSYILYIDSTSRRPAPFGFKEEDIFYYEPMSEICQVWNGVLQCNKIKTRCVRRKQLTDINQCGASCAKYEPGTFWNPVSMMCQSCDNAVCKCTNSHEKFNPYYRGCVTDCSKIPYATADSLYENATKCVCTRPYQWFDHSRECRVNCSSVNLAIQPKNIQGLSIGQCRCPVGYIYRPKLDGRDIPGDCGLECKNGKLQIGNHPEKCICNEGYRWNSSQNQCFEIEKVGKSFPGWAIAVIVIGCLLLLGIAGFLIRRFLIKKRAEKEKKEAAQTKGQAIVPSARNLSIAKNSKTDSPSKNPIRQLCPICKDEQNPINCKAPCGHSFHFFCIKPKIEQGQAQCPQCFKVLHNGAADLQYVQQKEEIITISDN